MPMRRINKHPNYSGSWWDFRNWNFASGFAQFLLWGFIASLVICFALVVYFLTQIPSPEELRNRVIAKSTKILDRNGELLFDIFVDENRTPVPIDQIPKVMRDATIAIEDKDFYRHKGFDMMGIVRSFFNLIIHRRIEGGGSTLTQQLVKNALLTGEQTLTRKLKELILAVQVERSYTKDQILEMYLTEIPYGGTAYGIESAANLYFGKHASELSLAEASLLAGLPQSPSVYSPYGTNPELAKKRQAEVLRRMVEDNYITADQAEEAKKQTLVYRTSQLESGIKAPHFVFYVKQYLIEKFGDKLVEQGGLQVTTTLDYKLQQEAEKIVKDEVAKLKNYKVGNAASVVMDPQNGHVLAMVGSKDYNGPTEPEGCTEGLNCVFEGNINVALRLRQPGSAGKPIAYAAGLQHGYTAASVYMDVKTDFPGGIGQPTYQPVNYDGQWHGPVQMRYALGNSFNIPAVKNVALAGVKDVLDLGYRMGLSTWEPSDETMRDVGLSLALGGRDVRLLDLTTAFGVFADKGFKHDPEPVLKVLDAKGKVLYEARDTEGTKVLDEGHAFIISNILADNGARTAAFGSNSVLNVPGKTVSVKTGTTDLKKDNWAVGFTPSVVTGVWVGNNDSTVMNPAIASGITGASPIWQKIMIAALKDKPDEKINPPDNVVQVDVDGLMGGKPKDGSPTRKEYFVKGTEPSDISQAYQRQKTCKVNPHRLANDGEDLEERDVIMLKEDDPSGANKWQEGIDSWVLNSADSRLTGMGRGCNNIPSFSSGGNQGGVIAIVNIANGANVPRVFDVLAKTNSPNGVKKVTWTIDGGVKSTQTGEPFALHVEFPNGDRGSHTITATLEDNNGQQHNATVGVTVNM